MKPASSESGGTEKREQQALEQDSSERKRRPTLAGQVVRFQGSVLTGG